MPLSKLLCAKGSSSLSHFALGVPSRTQSNISCASSSLVPMIAAVLNSRAMLYDLGILIFGSSNSKESLKTASFAPNCLIKQRNSTRSKFPAKSAAPTVFGLDPPAWRSSPTQLFGCPPNLPTSMSQSKSGGEGISKAPSRPLERRFSKTSCDEQIANTSITQKSIASMEPGQLPSNSQ